MATAAIATNDERRILRPLNVLVPLIKKDLELARTAGIQYHRAAGEKLLEAKEQIPYGEFHQWVRRNFGIGRTAASYWMRLAIATTGEGKLWRSSLFRK